MRITLNKLRCPDELYLGWDSHGAKDFNKVLTHFFDFVQITTHFAIDLRKPIRNVDNKLASRFNDGISIQDGDHRLDNMDPPAGVKSIVGREGTFLRQEFLSITLLSKG